ncbi:RNA methyltransferase [Maricaulis sp. CAU 1757]
MRGYFAVGAEGISKPMNLGAILRTAHAFGGSFTFSVGAHHRVRDVYNADTAKSVSHVPYYQWDDMSDMALPAQCQLVGIELTDEAVDLPSFRHPLCAAYVFGRERGSLSEAMQARCDHIVKIPTKFCVNVSVACAVTLYDRTLCFGGFPDRPLMPGGPAASENLAAKKFGHHR